MHKIESKNIKLIIGKVLVIIGSVIGIHPFLVILSIPLYLIGQIVIWTSKHMSQRKKILWTVVPILSILAIWSAILLITAVL